MSGGGRADLATTNESREIDSNCVEAAAEVAEYFKEHFIKQYQLSPSQWIEYYGEWCGGFRPDGGFWIFKKTGLVVAAFEAKKEDEGGNANERWNDNANTASVMNTNMKYHTFARGYIPKWIKREKKSFKEYNQRNLLDTRWSIKAEGFTREEMKNVMINTLNEVLDDNNTKHIYPIIKRTDANLEEFLSE